MSTPLELLNADARTSAARSVAQQAPLPAWIFGARGLLAGELLRLLELHPGLRLAGAASRSAQALQAAHPHVPQELCTQSNEEALAAIASALARHERVAVFLALPHGESGSLVAHMRRSLGASFERLALVDLAADFRLQDLDLYRGAYGHEHPAPAELPEFAYGLPEIHRATLMLKRCAAAAGCFATALQLAAWPAAKAGLLDPRAPWHFFGVTGSSGSGAEPKPGTHHPHRHGNLWAYSLDGHRHEAELAQCLRPLGLDPSVVFLPHSGPYARGIHLTATLPLAAPLDSAALEDVFRQAYAGEPFVEVLHDKAPDLRSVTGSNRVSIAALVKERTACVLLTLDNVVKGGAGGALQCMNVLLGFPETWGLPRFGLGVC